MINNSNNNPFNYVQSNTEMNRRIRNQERISQIEKEKQADLAKQSVNHISSNVKERTSNINNMNTFNKGIQNSNIKSMFNKNNF